MAGGEPFFKYILTAFVSRLRSFCALPRFDSNLFSTVKTEVIGHAICSKLYGIQVLLVQVIYQNRALTGLQDFDIW